MDFGKILDQWEKQGGGNGAHSDGIPDTVSEKKVNPIDAWLRTNKVYDKDADSPDRQFSAQDRRRRLIHKRPEAQLDIHGRTREEAWQLLETFFAASKNKGLEKILVIHGKGNHTSGEPVLRRTVMDFIERCPYAGESGKEKAASGGGGATWVLLKP